jgi:hypothetical protein
MNTSLRGALVVAIVVVGVASIIASGTGTPAAPTILGARTGTVMDARGNTTVATRTPDCLAGAAPFPDAPDAWWLGITPTIRQVAPVTGYRVWSNKPAPAGCATDTRTEVYRGLYEFDVTPLLGKSGAILGAVARITVRSTSVSPTSIAQPPLAPVEASFCDNRTAGAFQLMRVPPAVVFNNGFDILNNADVGNAARIPTKFPAGTKVFDFPNKNFTNPSAVPSPAVFEADITPAFVSTLQAFEALNTNPPAPARFARMVFMMTGTNEPPGLHNAPLPFSDCRGAYSVELVIRQP